LGIIILLVCIYFKGDRILGTLILHHLLVDMSVVILSISGLAVQNEPIILENTILVIPAFQSKMISGESHADGSLSGRLMGGNVTANFPEDLVVIGASLNLSEMGLIKLIKDKMSSYPCSCGEFLEIDMYDRKKVTLKPNSIRHNIFEKHNWISHKKSTALSGEYWMDLSINSVQQGIFLNFICEAIFYNSLIHDEQSNLLRKEITNQTIEMNPEETILIGFAPPKGKNTHRGSAHWVIIKKER
jgi:hypothetical protein